MAQDKQGAVTAPSGRTTLPAERAFVVQLRVDADLERGIFTGRVEHVLSGTAAPFASVAELLEHMRAAVAQRRESPAGSSDDSAS
jgi:hypothetical protein